MALIYPTTFRNLIAEYGFRRGFSNPSITIYAGTQPASSTLISSWSSYNSSSSNLLWHVQGSASSLQFSLLNNVTMYASTLPTSTNPVRNGTASWAVVWATNIAYSAMGISTIPSTYFMIVPVSLTTGNGVCRLQSTTLSTATATTISDFNFTVNL